MIGFTLSDEQKALKDLAHKFSEQEIIPKAPQHDASGEFPHDVVNKAREVGLMNLDIPEEYGGPGVGLFDECLVAEELHWGCSGMAASIGLNALAALPIIKAGTDMQKKKYLNRLTKEKQLAAYCVTEPSGGSDVAGMLTTAKKVGNDYVLNGQKAFITNATYSGFYVVFGYTDKAQKHKGMSAFIVERESSGLKIGRKLDKMGQRASDTAEIFFEDVKVPAENLLGKEGDGFKLAMMAFDSSRPGVGIAAVGVARRAMECALKYAQERTSFGMPIYAYQGINFMIADMAMKVEAARLLCWESAWMLDSGIKNTKVASFAKAYASDVCMEVTTNAVQVYGGYGYSKEYPVEKLMRDAKVFQIYEGTSQVQRLIIARELLRGS